MPWHPPALARRARSARGRGGARIATAAVESDRSNEEPSWSSGVRWQVGGPHRDVGATLGAASLREDYLIQVQRDFLSRRPCHARPSAPPAMSRAETRDGWIMSAAGANASAHLRRACSNAS